MRSHVAKEAAVVLILLNGHASDLARATGRESGARARARMIDIRISGENRKEQSRASICTESFPRELLGAFNKIYQMYYH